MIDGYDFVVLGGGTTAYAAARKGANMGARVLMVEHSKLGGTTINWGAIPSKILVHKAQTYFEARRGAEFGLNMSSSRPDWARLMADKEATVSRLRTEHFTGPLDGDERIDLLQGHARFISPHELQVGGEIVRADKFIIATGGVPRVVRIPGLERIRYLTSYSVCHVNALPESLIILGGGVVALETGQTFARFGTRVTLLERGPSLLTDFDPRLTAVLGEIVSKEGMRVLYNAELQRVDPAAGGVAVQVRRDGADETLQADQFMLAIGTAPASDNIGLEVAGVACDSRGFIQVDEQMRTTAPHIWAAGDVIGAPLIAPAGIYEGRIAAENLMDAKVHRQRLSRQMPMCVFIDPELAMVGFNAEQAAAEGLSVVESYVELDRVEKSHVMGHRRGGILLWAEAGSGRVLGCQMLVPGAAEVIHEAAMAVRFGLNVRDIAETVHVYPTIADGLRMAALENLKQQRILGHEVPGNRCICF